MENGRVLRILHCPDITLGNPYTGLPLQKCKECYQRFPEVFDRLIRYIADEKIDLVLLPGNLCSQYLGSEDARRLISAFSKLPACRFVIAPGDCDPYSSASLYASGRLPANVSVFCSSVPEILDFPELSVRIYGWAYCDRRISPSPMAAIRADSPDTLNLICGCCETDSPASFCSATPEEIEQTGADYAALGHGAATPVLRAGKTLFAHAGFLEGKSFEEIGPGGAIRLDVTKENDSFRIESRALSFSRHRYEILSIDITGIPDTEQLAGILQEKIAEKGYDENTSLRVILTGELSPTVFLRPGGEIQHLFTLNSIDFFDRTLPTYQADDFYRDMTVRGELFRTLESRFEVVEVDERTAVVRAFRIGLSALDSKDIHTV